ncbi:MAG: ROK family protein [Cyanobacteria bacterium SZAS LIN-2]|nr:ROK family protein [Cyanobacteria bacterium SZAS LIN-3]MBS1999399.1 ROK family protein [Cyanobacteria bacterium SZAS LIN-2]
MFGAIEAGGTKFVCGIGTGPDDVQTCQIPTTSATETLEAVVAFFKSFDTPLKSVGIGSFGPVDLDRNSPSYGCITSTPKPGWQDVDLVGTLGRALNVPIGFDTDVNAAALGEGRWGAAQGLSDFIYLTVGTGIGGGAVVNGQVVHGLVHPEMGHIRVPHDTNRDAFPGFCPFHGDCLEGLASGPALEARWGQNSAGLPDDHPAWALEAHYLAHGLSTWVCTLSPRRIILGGGVMKKAFLFPMIRKELSALLNGYVRSDALSVGLDEYVVPAQLVGLSGIMGGFVLAERAPAHSCGLSMRQY